MKSKILALAILTTILSACTTTGRCPRCGESGHFNQKRNQTLTEEKRTLTYVKDGILTDKVYLAPKVAETTDTWECNYGHVVQVKNFNR